MLSRFWYLGLAATGVTAITRRFARGGLILCYHNVVDSGSPPFGEPSMHLPLDRFEEQMRWLNDHYDVVPLGELHSRVDRGAAAHTAAITFDDAYGGVFLNAAPVLRQLKLPATVFVVADATERVSGFWWDHPSSLRSAGQHRRHMLITLRGDQDQILPDNRFPVVLVPPAACRPASWSMIRHAVSLGLSVGSHTCTHRTLTQLNDIELRDELLRSRETIARHTGQTPEWLAYPYGIWDRRVREATAAAGYAGALALDDGLNPAGSDRYALHRVNVPASITLPALGAWAAGLHRAAPAAAAV